jgi:hypothetical protein
MFKGNLCSDLGSLVATRDSLSIPGKMVSYNLYMLKTTLGLLESESPYRRTPGLSWSCCWQALQFAGFLFRRIHLPQFWNLSSTLCLRPGQKKTAVEQATEIFPCLDDQCHHEHPSRLDLCETWEGQAVSLVCHQEKLVGTEYHLRSASESTLEGIAEPLVVPYGVFPGRKPLLTRSITLTNVWSCSWAFQNLNWFCC